MQKPIDLMFTREQWLKILCVAPFAVACSSAEVKPAREPDTSELPSAPRKKQRVTELDPKRVVFAMRTSELDTRKCFFRAPNTRGFVRLAWRVDRSGSVQDVEVERSTVKNEAIEDCLKERVSELRFGDLEAPASARWTYAFRVATPVEDTARAKRDAKSRDKRKKRDVQERTEPGVKIEHTSPGFLDPDKIDSVIQAGFPLYAHCFRAGIGRDSRLSGTVSLRFIINQEGSVSKVIDGASDLPDKMLVDCVAEGFFALRFPEPEQGSVHVLYRVEFE